VFFNDLDPSSRFSTIPFTQAQTPAPALRPTASQLRRCSRGRLARLAAAVALAVPVMAISPLGVHAEDRPAGGRGSALVESGVRTVDDQPIAINLSLQPTPLSAQELLKKGVDELNNKQYEESLATLQQVEPDASWDDATRQTFADMLTKAETGATQRRAARAAFEKGEAELAAGNSVAAIENYRQAAENRFVDEGTRAKAREQIAVAENVARRATTDLKGLYAVAKADFKAGRYAEAKPKFEQLKASNYRAGLFEKSVSDYLSETNERIAAGFTGPAVAVKEVTATEVPPTPEAAARASEPYQEQAAKAAVGDVKKRAKDAYVMGRDQYRRGDWVAARENLTLANNLNYRPGLFEDSPAKMLARMDAKEQADAQRAMVEAQASAEREAAERAAREAEAAAIAAKEAEAAAELARMEAQAKAAPPVEPAVEPAVETPSTGSAPVASGVTTGAVGEPPVVTEAPVVTSEPLATEPAPAEAMPTVQDDLRRTAELTRAEAEKRAFDARELVNQADEAAAASKLDEALTLYTQAAALDPANSEASNGRNRMLQLTNRQPAARDLLAEQEKQILTRREAISFSFDNAINTANRNISATNYKDAEAAISQARIARATDPTIFQTAELNRFDAVIAETQNRLEQSRLSFESAAAQSASEEAVALQKAKEQAEREQRIATIKTLRRTAMEHTRQRDWAQALAAVDQILVLDRNDDYANGMRPFLLDQAQFAKQRKYRETFDRQMTDVLIENEEKRIPYNDILRYPENWPELSERRERTVEAERGASQEDQGVAIALDRKLPEINFSNVAFSDVVDFLRDVSQANIFVNWRALEAAGIAKDTQVSARLRDVKFAKVLNTVLNEVGGGTVRLGYTIDEGVITISTEEDLSANVVTRVYDIRDLIINIPDFDNAPDFNLQQQQSAGRGGGGGGNLFGGGGGGEDDEGPTRVELVDEIIRLIQDTVASDSWKDNGGAVGSLRELQGQLIVTQTPENQRQLVRLLEQLRETRAIQVTIEARFLSVQRNFLEDVGVDFDFAFANLDQDRFFDPTSISPTNPNPTPGVVRVLQNSFGFTQASNLDTSLPGNLASVIGGTTGAGPALSTGITFLDDFQVTALIRATQASQSVSTITAPRVTLFNGQRAYVLISTQRAYVSDLQPIVGTGAVGFDPTPALVNTGAILDVQATVSSDRKYVTLTLRPQVAQLLNLVNFQVAQATAGGTGDDGNAGVATGFIQQPEIQITEVRTTVSVPDGGTLLLGGQSLAAEIERESGVPVLSKIPFLKRLFTNRSMAKDDQVLLILVKPTIIIQREQEAKQFPLLSERAQ